MHSRQKVKIGHRMSHFRKEVGYTTVCYKVVSSDYHGKGTLLKADVWNMYFAPAELLCYRFNLRSLTLLSDVVL